MNAAPFAPVRASALVCTLFLVLCSHSLLAQGTEAALGSFFIFLVLLLAVVLVALVLLVTFAIKRGRVFAVLSLIMGVILSTVGILILVIMGDSHASEFEWIANVLQVAGLINLAVVSALLLLFPERPDKPSPVDGPTAEAGDRTGSPVVKWLSLVLLLWLFYQLSGIFSYWIEASRFSDGGDSFILLVQLLPLLVLAAGLVMLARKLTAGWYVAFMYLVYTLASVIIFFIRIVIVKTPGFVAPGGFFLSSLVIIAGLSACLALLVRRDIRSLFRIAAGRILPAVIAGLVCAAIVQLANAL